MAATPDRTTIKAAIEALTTQLRSNLVAAPPTATQPLRHVEVGTGGVESYPRPFLTLALGGTKPVSVVDDDKIVLVTMTLNLVTDITASDPHGAILDKIGAVDDYFDSVRDTGVIEGAEGFDDRAWKIDYPPATAGARVGVASAKQTFVVKIERDQNRVPAT